MYLLLLLLIFYCTLYFYKTNITYCQFLLYFVFWIIFIAVNWMTLLVQIYIYRVKTLFVYEKPHSIVWPSHTMMVNTSSPCILGQSHVYSIIFVYYSIHTICIFNVMHFFNPVRRVTCNYMDLTTLCGCNYVRLQFSFRKISPRR